MSRFTLKLCRQGLTGATLAALLTAPLFAQAAPPPRDQVTPPRVEYSPYADDHFPNRVFFGDTHLHSSWSTGAGMAGATLGTDVAYRVSRGEEVLSHLGWRVKLVRPLDFLVLADHAAVSDRRTLGSDGRARTPVGNTVDVEDASYTNPICYTPGN